jgi:hypothetical protein
LRTGQAVEAGGQDMKTSISKETITLAEGKAANDLRAEYNGYNGDIISSLIGNAIEANAHRISVKHIFRVSNKDILNIEKAEVTKNHYILTVWMSCTVKVDFETIIYIAFDANQAMQYFEGQPVDAYIEVYRKS